jgi:hypothetical protein
MPSEVASPSIEKLIKEKGDCGADEEHRKLEGY